MCGIAGVCNCRKAVPDPRMLREMIDSICHRRGEAPAVYVDRGIGLSCAGGREMMRNAAESIWIVCDGNADHRARPSERENGQKRVKQSNAEVILHLYEQLGEECVHHLDGQWTFAIWDGRQQTLFLSRNLGGARPLFYTRTQGSLLFASAIRCFLAHPDISLEPDAEVVGRNVTARERTTSSETAFEGVFQLMPGFSLSAHNGDLNVYQYWVPWHSETSEHNLDRDLRLASHG